MKRPSPEKIEEMRKDLFARVDAGTITIADASRLMRKILGMNRREYAENILKISHDALQAVETGKGNPTLKTLQAVGKPYGLKVAFVRKDS